MAKPESSRREGIGRVEMRDALLRSGYLLERRAASSLEASGWSTSVNNPYADPRTGEPRELDIAAFNMLSAGPGPADLVTARLIIECVNNPQPVAFLMSKARWPDLNVKSLRYSGEPTGLYEDPDSDKLVSLESFCDLYRIHHYCSPDISTQYCSFEQKARGNGKGDWFATHTSEHHKVFSDVVNALEQHVADDDVTLAGVRPLGVWLTLYYPIVVLQGDLVGVRPLKRSVSVKRIDHVQYQRSIVSQGVRTTYHIDVVTERYLPKLAAQIRKEAAHVSECLAKDPLLTSRSVAGMRRRASRQDAPAGGP